MNGVNYLTFEVLTPWNGEMKMPSTMTKKTDRSKDRHLPFRQVRLPEELYQRLQALADKAERPVSWQLRKAVLEHLEKHEAETE
jgi:hypothetical protein